MQVDSCSRPELMVGANPAAMQVVTPNNSFNSIGTGTPPSLNVHSFLIAQSLGRSNGPTIGKSDQAIKILRFHCHATTDDVGMVLTMS